MAAALKGASQIGFTIISLTVSLIAVLIPLLFMGDVVGRLFREFAVTLAITILISAVVSLTLVPMMSARWLKPHAKDEKPRRTVRPSPRPKRFFDGVMTPLRPRPELGHRAPGASRCWSRSWRPWCSRWCSTSPSPRACSRPRTPGSCRPACRPRKTSPTTACPHLQARGRAARSWQDPAVESLSSFVGVDAANNTMLHIGSMLINLTQGATAASKT